MHNVCKYIFILTLIESEDTFYGIKCTCCIVYM